MSHEEDNSWKTKMWKAYCDECGEQGYENQVVVNLKQGSVAYRDTRLICGHEDPRRYVTSFEHVSEFLGNNDIRNNIIEYAKGLSSEEIQTASCIKPLDPNSIHLGFNGLRKFLGPSQNEPLSPNDNDNNNNNN